MTDYDCQDHDHDRENDDERSVREEEGRLWPLEHIGTTWQVADGWSAIVGEEFCTFWPCITGPSVPLICVIDELLGSTIAAWEFGLVLKSQCQYCYTPPSLKHAQANSPSGWFPDVFTLLSRTLQPGCLNMKIKVHDRLATAGYTFRLGICVSFVLDIIDYHAAYNRFQMRSAPTWTIKR